ncbi:hypothetical protein U9M48_041705 [Paspalum notatum var. saurae]|uniref:Uncharacterized protein n=1 Tax=Paspalum notatum var. saurae TaxID=547442 RepID=A0AAQ3UPU2_PASNO
MPAAKKIQAPGIMATAAAKKKFLVKVKVRDGMIKVLKAHPPLPPPRPVPDDFLELLTPEDGADLLAAFAADALLMNKWRDEEKRILEEYESTGEAYETVEVEEGVLEQHRRDGVSYEVIREVVVQEY